MDMTYYWSPKMVVHVSLERCLRRYIQKFWRHTTNLSSTGTRTFKLLSGRQLEMAPRTFILWQQTYSSEANGSGAHNKIITN
jgi:hypothetical protein